MTSKINGFIHYKYIIYLDRYIRIYICITLDVKYETAGYMILTYPLVVTLHHVA